MRVRPVRRVGVGLSGETLPPTVEPADSVAPLAGVSLLGVWSPVRSVEGTISIDNELKLGMTKPRAKRLPKSPHRKNRSCRMGCATSSGGASGASPIRRTDSQRGAALLR